MVWLVAVIPAASVVASFALLFAAARSSGNNDAVADQVQRTAQIQVADLGPDLAARQLGLAAQLRIDGERIAVSAGTAPFPRDAVLRLSLHHPARAQDDVQLMLQPSADGWTARHVLADSHDWNLELAPVDGSWRLQGRLTRGQGSAELQPALAAP